jgi:hypothetical protein
LQAGRAAEDFDRVISCRLLSRRHGLEARVTIEFQAVFTRWAVADLLNTISPMLLTAEHIRHAGSEARIALERGKIARADLICQSVLAQDVRPPDVLYIVTDCQGTSNLSGFHYLDHCAIAS